MGQVLFDLAVAAGCYGFYRWALTWPSVKRNAIWWHLWAIGVLVYIGAVTLIHLERVFH